MPKFKIVTEKANYKTSSKLEAPDSQHAWELAIEGALRSDERVVSVEPVVYGIYCVRSAGSRLGASEAWMKGKDDKPLTFESPEAAQAEVDRVRAGTRSVNLSYFVQEYN